MEPFQSGGRLLHYKIFREPKHKEKYKFLNPQKNYPVSPATRVVPLTLFRRLKVKEIVKP